MNVKPSGKGLVPTLGCPTECGTRSVSKAHLLSSASQVSCFPPIQLGSTNICDSDNPATEMKKMHLCTSGTIYSHHSRRQRSNNVPNLVHVLKDMSKVKLHAMDSHLMADPVIRGKDTVHTGILRPKHHMHLSRNLYFQRLPLTQKWMLRVMVIF